MLVDEEKKKKNNYVALGSFDGLHKGHLQLVEKIIKLAKENEGNSILYTFKNHPKTILENGYIPKLLMSNINKEEILKKLGVDIVYFQEFTTDFMKKSPEEFIKYLVNKFYVKGIVVGFNYKFGYKNVGDIQLLKELAKKYNFEVYIIKPCTYKGLVISSTRIRREILDGNVEEATKMLSRFYFLNGIVDHGKEIGRTIGFPTANLKTNKEFILPKEGVYYTNVIWNNNVYKAITSIGNNPTVNGEKVTVESYILNFNNSIYDDEIEVYFIKRIRDNRKFDSLEELKQQLNSDKIFAEKEKF